mgnify:CR=1 FL=1
MSLVSRKIDVVFRLGKGSFGDSGADTVTLKNLRVAASIVKAGGQSMGSANLRIYGMTFSLMNQLSTLGPAPTLYRRNTVTVLAGDDVNGMGTVFVGTIVNAYTHFQMPENPFMVEAYAGMIEALAPVPASSFQGSADVAAIMSGLATQMNLVFENNGVNVKLSNPYFSGSPRNQVQACAEAAGIAWIIDGGKLAIWNPGEARGGQVPLISLATGLKGYPNYTSRGIMLETLYQPSIGFGVKINVQSDLKPASGEWIPFTLQYQLDSLVPDGSWFISLEAARPGYVVVR